VLPALGIPAGIDLYLLALSQGTPLSMGKWKELGTLAVGGQKTFP
jgi:hypothetical protein